MDDDDDEMSNLGLTNDAEQDWTINAALMTAANTVHQQQQQQQQRRRRRRVAESSCSRRPHSRFTLPCSWSSHTVEQRLYVLYPSRRH